MVDVVDQETAPPTLATLFRNTHLNSTAMERISDWIFTQDVPGNVTIRAGGATFSLLKFPVVSKSGYIRKLLSEPNGSDLLDITDIPGGAKAFELVISFCYGKELEISVENVAMLRCIAEHLEMTEDYSDGNLVEITEGYLNEVALGSLPTAITVLHCSESLLPIAETVNLISRCIDAIAKIACQESNFSLLKRFENSQGNMSPSPAQRNSFIDWWAEDLTVLRIDMFQRVLMAMKAKGFKQYALGTVLMLYAQKSLRGLDIFGRGRNKMEPRKEHEKRVVLETVASLLPREKNALSVSFLTTLLRAAIYLETTIACRLDLEKIIGLQLGQAVLDDLLIPSFSFAGDTVFDVDTVQRIFVNYLEHDADGVRLGYHGDDIAFTSLGDRERVGRLMECYLVEIASDPNLSISRFVGLAELIPEQARITEDGMYRAIDIYLKAHPSLSDAERKKICSVMDCQRLSREACAHAAHNDRLPVQIVVQVLYYEQQRLRDAVGGGLGSASPLPSQNKYSNTSHHNPVDELSHLRRENDDLKLEMVRMKMQMGQAEKPGQPPIPSANKPPLPKKSIINSVSKKLGRLNPFQRFDAMRLDKARAKMPKSRRHSIS